MGRIILKKIGLITLHSFFNYGSMLQAYALNQYLNTCRPDVSCELIDYVPPRQDNKRSYRLYGEAEELHELKERYSEDLQNRKKRFIEFMALYTKGVRYNSDEEIEKNPPKYDIYVSGSDQIWNVNFRIASRAYFLAFAKSNQKFAFASSVGRCQLDKLEKYKPFIMDYNKIFIREESGAEKIRLLTGREDVSVMSDPTLLFEGKDWNKIIPTHRFFEDLYIACYATLDDQLDDMIPILEKLHRQMKLPVVLFGMALPREKPWIRNIVAAGPVEFLHIIRDASLILTHSFHGTAFSINFGVPFLTFNDATENFRKTEILKRFGLLHRIVHNLDEVDNALAHNIDYAVVAGKVRECANEARKDINQCLGR